MIPKTIKNETEYEAALVQLDQLMGAAAGSPEADKLKLWANRIERYEQEAHPIEKPTKL